MSVLFDCQLLPRQTQRGEKRSVCLSLRGRKEAQSQSQTGIFRSAVGGGDLPSPTLPSLANVTAANLCNIAGRVDEAPVRQLPPTD